MKPAVIDNGFYLLDSIPHGIRGQPLYALRGGKWDYIIKKYRVPITPGNAGTMRLLGYDIPEVITQIPDAVPKGKASLRLPCADRLRPYQAEGVCQIEAWNGRVLLADEMGLGKSAQALAWASAHLDKRPLIVVCPSCAKLNWKDEVGKWLPNEQCSVLSSTRVDIPDNPILIINYDILHYWVDELIKLKPQIVVCDEAHRLRNWRAASQKGGKPDKYGRKGKYNLGTDSTLRLCRDVSHVLALSGTPIYNRTIELFNVLHLLRPSIFPSRYEFGMAFCGAELNRWSGTLTFKGCTKPDELNKLLRRSVMIRRLKEEVLTELPAKQWTTVPLDIDNLSEYKAVENNLGDNPLTKLGHLRQLAGKGKLTAAFEWIDSFLEECPKLVLFCHHRAIGEALSIRYKGRCVTYSGGMGEAAKWSAVQKFQTDKSLALFIGSLDACGVAINLTASSNVAVLEFPWTKTALDQAVDRVHRLGQKGAVNVWMLMASGTIDEDMSAVLADKARVAGSILDGDLTQDAAMRAVLVSLQRRMRRIG